jgi:hypothetical protein
MAVLMANRETIKKGNTEGYMALQIITKFEELLITEQEKILTPVGLNGWLNNVFGVELDHNARILVVLRHTEFRRFVLRYCSTRYGEKHFSWSTMVNIISSKLDEVGKYIIPIIIHNSNYG